MEVSDRPSRAPSANGDFRAREKRPAAGAPPLDVRRIVDVVAATGLLLVSAPLLLLGALTVLVGSGTPVFFGHFRVGRGGRPFRCWKLRTMAVDAEKRLERNPDLRQRHRENGYKLPTGADPRVTKVGRWLRRTYLDELPQLFNVLNGTMTLVGPRPVVEEELEQWFEDGLDELLDHRPGVFGAWVSRGGRRPPYPERARLELEYLRTRTLRKDLEILGRSVGVILQGEGEDATSGARR